MADAPTVFAPGRQLSDHEHVTLGNQPIMPRTQSLHEDLVRHPNIVPVDTAHKSVSEAQAPLGPATTLANIPSGPNGGSTSNLAPGTVANDPSDAKPLPEVWETNHRKHPPASTLGNIPTTSAVPASNVATGSLAGAQPVGGMANVPPGATGPAPPVLADTGTLADTGSGGAPATIHPMGTTPQATAPADPKKGGRKAVRWDSHLPGKDVVMPPSKTSTPQ